MGTLSCVEWLARGVSVGLALVVSKVPTHTPIVIPAKAGSHYAAAHRSARWRLWNTGSDLAKEPRPNRVSGSGQLRSPDAQLESPLYPQEQTPPAGPVRSEKLPLAEVT